MLRALAADAAAVPGWRVVVTWDAALEPFGVPGVEIRVVHSREEEQELFLALAAGADVTFVIAPEFGRLLETRSRAIAQAGGRSAGAMPEAIALCGDKLALAEHLERCGIATVKTRRCDFAELEHLLASSPDERFIVKPRFGAGSIDLFRVGNRSELAAARQGYTAGESFGEPLVQPFVSGISLSVAGIVSPSGIELLPVGRQQIVGGQRPKYEGGSLPAATGQEGAVADLAKRALASISGLRGYVGVDLLLSVTDNGFGLPVVVEINPRLTTSYLGYRMLAEDNLAERLLAADGPYSPVRWRAGRVEFSYDGRAAFRSDGNWIHGHVRR